MTNFTKWKLTPDERQLQSLKLFPFIDREQLPEALRSRRLREEVMADIEKDPVTLGVFQKLAQEYQEAVVQFCMGNRGMSILYDPFFKQIFREEKMERLEKLLSLIMGQKVTIVKDIPLEVTRRGDDASLMIMDLVVQLESGAYVNLEIQRNTHDFPFERAECYASDIMVYQYDQLKIENKVLNRRIKERNAEKGEDEEKEKIIRFDYRQMHPVYVIVLMNSRSKKFDRYPDDYIHKSIDEMRFDTGLTERSLKNYIYVSLDIFRKMEHNELTELEAWMYFLASDKPEDVKRVIEKYPEFMNLYQEIIRFRYNPKELMTMVPEAIRMMDEGSFQLMIDRLQEELDTKVGQLAELTEQNEELTGQNEELAGRNEELAGRNAKLKDEKRQMLVENVDNVMKNFHVDLQTACAGLGTTVEAYTAAKEAVGNLGTEE